MLQTTGVLCAVNVAAGHPHLFHPALHLPVNGFVATDAEEPVAAD